jgi:glutathione-independent formaldehyde dehydrogenase
VGRKVPHGVILKAVATNICGSDQHMVRGRTTAPQGLVLGHEITGEVVEAGPGVEFIKVGDLVSVPFNIACGRCRNCKERKTGVCLNVNPERPGSAYGYVDMGGWVGGQAEYVMVPYADWNLLKFPDKDLAMEKILDLTMLSDIFPTGYHATELAGVGPGDTVAVFGAGPVGLLAAYSAILRGAAEVYVVDGVAERLAKAEEIGAIGIDYNQGEPCQQIFDLRKKNPLVRGSLRPGEEKMSGVMCGIDAVGYQARRFDRPEEESPMQVIEELVHVVNPTGRIGIVGVYFPSDPGGVDKQAKEGQFQLSLGAIFEKGLSIGTGQTPVKRYNAYLRDLIVAGRAKPSFIVSHRLTLEEAPAAYAKFDQRSDGYTKVVLKPEANAAS